VLELLVAGRSLKEIAAKRGVSVQSVWKHEQRILQKFAVQNEVELVQVLMRARSQADSGA
jgi:DNA-binding CsgD family transcriptional regulator